ncbi:Calcium and integrin-binding protein 1 [Intoshia linei]|uniref:Calcium and integrin-binding protein 1 n=1 Tax=Intoshia linei TaxID=1819745 RepID=A0A177B3A9_9BILA|nr:Calcium and integrin-binding protein 1 [Intoshia linei]
MGNSISYLSIREVNKYQDLLYLSAKEIKKASIQFMNIYNELNLKDIKFTNIFEASIPIKDFTQNCPEICVNPFRHRLCQLFHKQTSMMKFEDYLDILSIFSNESPTEIKIYYVFKLYDFDEDSAIGCEDLLSVIHMMMGTEDTKQFDKNKLINKLFKEADIDENGTISYTEFQNIVMKMSNFTK